MQKWVMMIDIYYLHGSGRHNIYCILSYVLHGTTLPSPYFWVKWGSQKLTLQLVKLLFIFHGSRSSHWSKGLFELRFDENKSKSLSSHKLTLAAFFLEKYIFKSLDTLSEGWVTIVWNPIEKDQRINEKLKKMITGNFYRWAID